MKKILIGLAFLLSSLALSAQVSKDSTLQSSQTGLVHDGVFDQSAVNSVITFTHHNTIPTHVVVNKVGNADSTGLSVSVGNFIKTWVDTEGNTYFYYSAIIENNKEAVTFAVRYVPDGSKFDSIGFIRADQTIIVFFITPTAKSL
jgi:hypothetical protein